MSVFNFSIALIAMPLDKSCNASTFVPRSSQRNSFFWSLFNKHTHTLNTDTCRSAERIWRVCSSDCSISPHAVVECRRCTILGSEYHSILGRNTHGRFEKSVKKKCSMFKVRGVYSKEVHLYGKVECTYSKFKVRRCSFRGVQSNRFHCIFPPY